MTHVSQATLAIRYNQGWRYAISDVSWRGHNVIEPDTQAAISFKGTFQGGVTAVRGFLEAQTKEEQKLTLQYSNTWTLRDGHPDGPGGFGRPKGGFKAGKDWEDRKIIDPGDQIWSPANQMSSLSIAWKVSFQSTRTRGMLSVLGDTSKGGNPLALRIGLKFRQSWTIHHEHGLNGRN